MTTILGVHQPEPAHNVLSLKTEVQAVLNQAEGSVALRTEVTGVTISEAKLGGFIRQYQLVHQSVSY